VRKEKGHSSVRTSGVDALRRLSTAGLLDALGTAPHFYDLLKKVNTSAGSGHDTFAASGFAAAMAVLAVHREAGSTSTDDLVRAFEGLEFTTPKGSAIHQESRMDDDFSTQRVYKRCLIKLQSVKREDGRWVPKCGIAYPTREQGLGAHSLSLDANSANTLEVANAVAFVLAKKWINQNEELF